MAESSRSASAKVMRIVLLVLLTGLAWRVLSLGMADSQSRAAPANALQWRPQHSVALVALAQQQVKNPALFSDARKNALAALQAYPFEGAAYRVLGQIAEAEKKPAQAYEYFQKAIRYSPRDLESHVWLMDYSLRTENAEAAVLHLDNLLRMQLTLLPQLMPTIGGLAQLPQARAALIRALEKNPAWRTPAINTLTAEKDAAQHYAVFFNELAKSKSGMNDAEQQAWLRALNQGQQWSLAYLNWASQLPADRQLQLANLFNGGFEYEPLKAEFDWTFDRVPGASIDRAFREGAEGEKALRIRFDDRRVPFNSVRQTLVLPAGRYRFAGQGYAEDLRTELGLVWTVQCLGSGLNIATGEPWKGQSKQWQAFALDFEVPASQCPAQSLLLKLPARVPSEQDIGGSIWFDGLRIQKIQRLAPASG